MIYVFLDHRLWIHLLSFELDFPLESSARSCGIGSPAYFPSISSHHISFESMFNPRKLLGRATPCKFVMLSFT